MESVNFQSLMTSFIFLKSKFTDLLNLVNKSHITPKNM